MVGLQGSVSESSVTVWKPLSHMAVLRILSGGGGGGTTIHAVLGENTKEPHQLLMRIHVGLGESRSLFILIELSSQRDAQSSQ